MKLLKSKISIILILILISISASARKPFRIGLKAGLPNVASLNAEFVLPVLGGRIAPTADFSDFSINIDDVKADFTYFEAGVNFYLAPNGKWAYANVSYINMKTDLSYTGLESNDGQFENGVATADVPINSLSFKIGAKLGGFFYVRPEIGFLVTPMDDEIPITVSFNGFQEQQTEEVPSALTGSFIFNFGFGFAF